MASTASGSESSSTLTSIRGDTVAGGSEQMEQRPQAGPLPVKRPRLAGEIGYSEHVEDLEDVDLGDAHRDDTDMDSAEGLNAAEADARNGRHPADRSHVNIANQSTASLPIPPPASPDQVQPNHPNQSTSTLDTTAKQSTCSFHSFTSCLTAKKYGGVSLKTLIRLVLLGLVLCGLIIAWVFAAQHFAKSSIASTSESPNAQPSGTSAIFIHVAFAILCLLMIIFIERSVFQFRAERYAHIHPGQVLPSHRHRTNRSTPHVSNGMAFAPWNRPPLPTYAAALGIRGTGDVEDTIIAAPPPPAYGNTRGSTLVLASFLRNSRASNRSRASVQGTDAPWQIVGRPAADGRMSGVSTRSMRPVSYEEAEHHSDVERARILEEALSKLENGAGSER